MKIVITSGDTNGIGLETLFKGFPAVDPNSNDFALCINTETLVEYAKKANLNIEVRGDKAVYMNRTIELIHLNNGSQIDFGAIAIDSGQHSADSVEKALELTQSGEFDAMVTLPISKEAIYLTGWKFTGHTEMLAAKSGVESPLMILFKDRIRVAIASIHMPLKEVPGYLSKNVIYEKALMLHESLKKDFAVEQPKIAVLGLNPHAGESGNIGTEEIEYINECVEQLQSDDINAEGPFPADGFFAHGGYLGYDATLAMYHDQGLIPMKMLARGGGVNYTAGLPIVRTSPDHGTAFMIAGQGRANPQSTIDAINAAIDIAKVRKSRS